MVKSINALRESVRSSKLTGHPLDSQPGKAHRHRYERRKVRQYMRTSDWTAEADAEFAR